MTEPFRMQRRTFLELTAAGSAGLALGSCGLGGVDRRPDIVLIFVDDLGYSDLSSFGCTDYATPHIDAIGERGARLTDFYTAAPVCTPSRYALMTGRQPFGPAVDLTTALMPSDTRGLAGSETTLPEVLRDAGYRTACVGKWHLGRLDPAYHPHRHGFEHFYGFQGGLVDYYRHAYAREHDWWRNTRRLHEEGYVTDLITHEAETLIATSDGRPLFLYLAYSAPHYARDEEGQIILQPRGEDLSRFAHIADPKRRAYAAMVTALDEGVGRVVRALEASGRVRNTLLLFVSDNGPELAWGGTCTPLRGAKRFLYEGGIRMPALAQWPGRIQAGTTLAWPGSTLDLFPTFAALAGAPTAKLILDGQDISGQLQGGEGGDRDLVWRYGGTEAIRSGRWKLVRTQRGIELFDLENDLSENTDLSAIEPERASALTTRLDAALADVLARTG